MYQGVGGGWGGGQITQHSKNVLLKYIVKMYVQFHTDKVGKFEVYNSPYILRLNLQNVKILSRILGLKSLYNLQLPRHLSNFWRDMLFRDMRDSPRQNPEANTKSQINSKVERSRVSYGVGFIIRLSVCLSVCAWSGGIHSTTYYTLINGNKRLMFD